jgi:hypothetical protein
MSRPIIARPLARAFAVLALAAVLGSAFHEALHLLAEPTHSDSHCTACQAAHGGGLPSAMPALPSVAVRDEPVLPGSVQTVRRFRMHAICPRGPPTGC